MKNSSKILKSIMVALGMEIKLERMMLMDGVTKIEADSFAPEMEVFVVTEDDQKIELIKGEYELEDGRILVVEMDGIISAINDAPMQEEEVAEEEVAVEAEKEVTAPTPKSIIESTSKEYKFSMEEMEAKIVELEAKILELTKVEEDVELSEEPKPISFNPENVTEVEVNPLHDKLGKSKRDSILESIYN